MAGFKTLGEHRDDLCHVELLCNAEETKAYIKLLQARPEGKGSTLSKADMMKDNLLTMLDQAGVVAGVDEQACSSLSEQVVSGEIIPGGGVYLVAKTKSPLHGDDGRFEYAVEPSAEEVYFDVDNRETIDYKNTNLIQNVIEEQLLATVIGPSEGEDGESLMGHPILARQGLPMKIKLGSNVTVENGQILSTCAGRFIKDGDCLAVNPVYVIRDDVGLRVGNVNFIGKVEAKKDILDDFSVFAKVGIDVGGTCGAANVESDGDIILQGGVNGKGKGFVRSQGKIESKYLNELTAVAWGDICVTKSVINCTVKTKGKLDATHGNVIGGEVMALMGIDVGSVGSDMGVLTTLIVGQDYELSDRRASFEAQLQKIGDEVDRIDRIIGPVLANRDKLMALPLDKKKALKGLLEQVKRYREEQNRICIEAEALEAEVAASSVKEIIVRKTMYSGVRIVIGKCKKIIKADIKGPVLLREDIENDTISITSVTL